MNLPNTLLQFDGKEEVTLELPICVYCEEKTEKNNPVIEHNGEMICYDCRIEFIYDEYFPKEQSAESKIHEKLMEDLTFF